MKICNRCNSQIEDNASFCPYCGQKAGETDGAAYEEAFHTFRRNLRHERKCWSIFGWVYTGMAIFFVLYFMLIATVAGAATEEFATAVGVVFLSTVYIVFLFAPIVIVNFVMKSKLDKYVTQIETDPEPAKDRATRVGMIVLGGIFNPIAMIFIILNFVHVKNNGHLIRK